MTQYFHPSKHPEEKEYFGFDFKDVIPTTAGAIEFAEWEVELASGRADPTPTNILQGPSIISGMKVARLIVNGLAGRRYHCWCHVTTADGQVFTLDGVLAVST